MKVLVTGGTRGIGLGIARAFLAAGAEVVVGGRREVALADLPVVQGDLRDPAEAARVVEEAAALLSGLDVLVSNAGGSPPAEAATASPRFSEKIVQLNLLAPLWVAQAANRLMQRAGGVIIHVASVSGLRPSPGTAAYGAAKAGLIHLTTSLAVEWAPKVRVNAISPGPIATEDRALHFGDAGAQARIAETIPLARLGAPEDVAAACLFLASEEARWMSGANLVLHGGGERPAFLGALNAGGPSRDRP